MENTLQKFFNYNSGHRKVVIVIDAVNKTNIQMICVVQMKGCRKCHPGLKVGDSVRYMEVNKGAQKIITAIPDQLTVLFTWTVLTVVFVFFFAISAYLVLRFELSAKPTFRSGEPAVPVVPSALYAQKPPAVVNVTAREFCTTVSKDLYSLEQIGYVDTDRRVSKLTGLDVGAGDVHFVFTDQTYVSWLSTCSLESVVRSIGNSGRVNVFVVSGIEFERPLHANGQNKIRPVNLSYDFNTCPNIIFDVRFFFFPLETSNAQIADNPGQTHNKIGGEGVLRKCKT